MIWQGKLMAIKSSPCYAIEAVIKLRTIINILKINKA